MEPQIRHIPGLRYLGKAGYPAPSRKAGCPPTRAEDRPRRKGYPPHKGRRGAQKDRIHPRKAGFPPTRAEDRIGYTPEGRIPVGRQEAPP